MWILSIFLGAVFIAGSLTGSSPNVILDKLSKERVLNGALAVLLFFTVLMIAYSLGYFPQSIAAPFMMTLYSFLAGFFAGYGWKQFRFRAESGTILYQYRSFWTDHAPNLLAAALIIYGFYRTSLLIDQPVTGIRLTSGLSLIFFGIFTWTLKPVPEFRSEGILFLDRFIEWKRVISWHWESESILAVEYLSRQKNSDYRIRQFVTSIPETERNELEAILRSKMDEFSEERNEIMLNRNS
jgi:hypothetical protein